MSLKLAARLVTLIPTKILDLQENDITVHIADLSSFIPPGTKAILIQPKLIAGAGTFRQYPISSATYVTASVTIINIAPIKDRELKWSNSLANDDWDIWLYGYFVQKRTSSEKA